MTDSRRKVLILFAHPSQERSEVNVHLFRAAQDLDFVTAVDLYREYPKHDIDIETEQDRVCNHDCIVFLYPLYWYSTPAILKDWQDLVLEYGFAYGKEGSALRGKTFVCALTAGGAEEAYQTEGYNHFNIRELLRPLEQTARFCHMKFLPPFALFGARTAVEEDRLGCHLKDWRKLLDGLSRDAFEVDADSELQTINPVLTGLQC